MPSQSVLQALHELSVEVRGARSCLYSEVCLVFPKLCQACIPPYAELDVGTEVQPVAWPLTPLQFYRDFVSRNKPCLLTGKSLLSAGSNKCWAGIHISSWHCRRNRPLASFVTLEPDLPLTQAA